MPPGWPNVHSTTCCRVDEPDPAHTCEGQGCAPDDPSGTAFYAPSSTDFTLQANDVWFFEPGAPLRPLEEMIATYHATIGANTVMELDFAIDRTGQVAPSHAALYKAFGDWRRKCYDHPIAAATLLPGASSVVLPLGVALMGCPKLPPVSGCAPMSQRCSPAGAPEVCSSSQRWEPAGDLSCTAAGGVCVVGDGGIAHCAPAQDGGVR